MIPNQKIKANVGVGLFLGCELFFTRVNTVASIFKNTVSSILENVSRGWGGMGCRVLQGQGVNCHCLEKGCDTHGNSILVTD